ncbi:hypothetical protein ACE1AT_22195 [Pelatocladus sp. BLCC-F211]|uniref:hypothetical protein n=1 Tax=Pelatocladus sp. BLCC-F211 TaxID=3342752 RepID=UPI0035BAEE5F
MSMYLAQQTARGDRHDEALRQLENSMQALSQTQPETLRLIADNSREIQRIWQHLERRFDGNGNERNDQ